MFIVGKYHKSLINFSTYVSEFGKNKTETPVKYFANSYFLFLGEKNIDGVTDLKILINGEIKYLSIHHITKR